MQPTSVQRRWGKQLGQYCNEEQKQAGQNESDDGFARRDEDSQAIDPQAEEGLSDGSRYTTANSIPANDKLSSQFDRARLDGTSTSRKGDERSPTHNGILQGCEAA